MTFIDLFTWFVLLIVIATVVAVFVFMGLWPGKVARQRNHPQAEAIQIGSWATLILGFVFWPLVLTWAYTRPQNISVLDGQPGDEADSQDRKIENLEKRVAQIESDQGGAQ